MDGWMDGWMNLTGLVESPGHLASTSTHIPCSFESARINFKKQSGDERGRGVPVPVAGLQELQDAHQGKVLD